MAVGWRGRSHHGTPRLAELEARVLNRVMRKTPVPVRAVKVG
ncbi:aliphatic sulfonate ABC transporter ATP-binding protein, partial [Cronobacter sakazakii]